MKISVVIAAYNEEKLISQCVKAVVSQSYPRENYEILVIDNKSTDDTAKLARAAGATVLAYNEKQGFTVTKQFGAEQAKGDIIAYMDADTIPDKNWLEEIDTVFQDSKLQCIGGTVLSTGNNILANTSLVFYDWFSRFNELFGIPLIWGCNMAIRKSAFKKVKGINLELQTSDDWDLVKRVQQEYGRSAVLYTPKLRVKTSTRKQESLAKLIPYLSVGILNYVSIFILGKSKTFGKAKSVR